MVAEAGLTPEEILNRALAKEKAAFNYYDRLLRSTNIDLIQGLLQELKNEEYKHIKMIESKIRQLSVR